MVRDVSHKGLEEQEGGGRGYLAAKNTKNTEKEEKFLHHLHFYTANI